jgi:hypothetical protein
MKKLNTSKEFRASSPETPYVVMVLVYRDALHGVIKALADHPTDIAAGAFAARDAVEEVLGVTIDDLCLKRKTLANEPLDGAKPPLEPIPLDALPSSGTPLYNALAARDAIETRDTRDTGDARNNENYTGAEGWPDPDKAGALG